MKYIFLVLFFLIAVYFFLTLNFFDNHWHYIQPLLIAVLLVYFNTANPWLYYTFALVAGFFIDAFSPVFGLQATLFITIIFILNILRQSVFTSRHMSSIIVLTASAFIFFGFLFYLINFIFHSSYYHWSQLSIPYWALAMLFNILAVSFGHILYFNLWLKKNEK